MMPPTGMREALHRGRQMAKTRFEKTKRKNNHWGSFDDSLECVATVEEIRDTLGFSVRPQHLERYREYANVYKEEEIERDIKWKQFLNTYPNFGDSDGSFQDEFDEDDWNWGGLCAVEQFLQRRGKKGELIESENGDIFADELTKNVRSGVPAALRGELWQVFAGAKERWVEGQYQELLASREVKVVKPTLEKWASQIEKDLPRTFPGNPKLGKDRLDSLRRILTAYARHNPEVGYCQAMNFLAALLLLLMPEENAFWTLTSIIDDYFGGYYTERMTEAQVDQLVFAEVVREHFPKLANHLDAVEVEISWFSGAWFLSIFVNVLPWESVLRVWDVLLYEGNRSMLFRTALALLEKHAEALVQELDNGAVLLMLQSMGESTFDSSQLVLSACYGFPTIDEELLQSLRDRHRPAVMAALHKRSLDMRQWRTAKLDATTNGSLDLPIRAVEEGKSSLELQFSGQKCLLNAIDEETSGLESKISALKCLDIAEGDEERNTLKPNFSGQKGLSIAAVEERGALRYQLSAPKFFTLEPLVSNQNHFFKGGSISRIDDTDAYEGVESFDLQKEVSRLRKELDRELQAREQAECRVEGLKDAFTEIEKSNRHLSAQVQEMERQVAHFKQALADKHEQEAATVEVLVRLERENRKGEEARRRAVEEAEENRQIANRAMRGAAEDILAMEKRAVMAESMMEAIEQQAAEELRAMEKRAVMAESMLEATLNFHAGTAPRTNRSVDPKLKGSELKDSARFHNHTNSKLYSDSALEKRQHASKFDEAEKISANKTSILGRSFPLREKSKVSSMRSRSSGGKRILKSFRSPKSCSKSGSLTWIPTATGSLPIRIPCRVCNSLISALAVSNLNNSAILSNSAFECLCFSSNAKLIQNAAVHRKDLPTLSISEIEGEPDQPGALAKIRMDLMIGSLIENCHCLRVSMRFQSTR